MREKVDPSNVERPPLAVREKTLKTGKKESLDSMNSTWEVADNHISVRWQISTCR